MNASLGSNAASSVEVDIGNAQCDEAGEHRVRSTVQLSDADPLRGIAELFSSDAEQITAYEGNTFHVSRARIVEIDGRAPDIGASQGNLAELTCCVRCQVKAGDSVLRG